MQFLYVTQSWKLEENTPPVHRIFRVGTFYAPKAESNSWCCIHQQLLISSSSNLKIQHQLTSLSILADNHHWLTSRMETDPPSSQQCLHIAFYEYTYGCSNRNTYVMCSQNDGISASTGTKTCTTSECDTNIVTISLTCTLRTQNFDL